MPIDISQLDNPVVVSAFRYFCRHLVCLGGVVQEYDKKGQKKEALTGFAFSAFVLVIRGEWFLLTAGHTLKGLDARLQNGELKLIRSYLLTGFGPDVTAHAGAKVPIDFDYEKANKDYIDQDGLDFGLLDLGTYLRAHLEKNEIVPVMEENWKIPFDGEFDHYVILGLPQEYVDVGQITPTITYIHKLDTLPDDAPEESKHTKWPRLIGKLPDHFSLKSLEGMSGGPIYGFRNNHPDRYWITAIQSSWLPTSKITFGCPVPLLASLAEHYMFEDS
jgi:hypothetical protein